jgi:hypothetical protein
MVAVAESKVPLPIRVFVTAPRLYVAASKAEPVVR